MTKSLKNISQTAEDAFTKARKVYYKTNFRDRYFEGLRDAQIFEMYLNNIYTDLVEIGSSYFESISLKYEPINKKNMNIGDYLKRIKTFFPEKENKVEYKKLEKAIEARNDFIHDSFKIKIDGNYSIINLDMEDIHEDNNAQKKISDWRASFGSTLPILFKWAKAVNEIRKKVKI